MKKLITLLLTFILLVQCFSIAFAADVTATLYSYYGNDMLFKQLDEVVLAGTAAPGAEIKSTLYDNNNTMIATTTAIVAKDGKFTCSFTAPAGGYEEYTISMYVNGKNFSTLTGVVFGELWLAGGQSNMHTALEYSETGKQMKNNNKTGSDAVRFLLVPHLGAYNGNENYFPSMPIDDYGLAAKWHKASSNAVYELSAVGYFFAEKLSKDLDMPVGILNANLGGTSIWTWLSRSAIENDADLLNDCINNERYISLSAWKENKINCGIDMTCNFNDKIAPLKNFRLSGMIWYQGESDLSWPYGQYSRALNLLQESYTEHFSYKDGLLPIVLTQLASYSYGDLNLLQNKNMEFTEFQQQQPESRAVTSIYDIPLSYWIATHAIHPICKKPVGEKMAFAAEGLVYNKHNSYTAATVSDIVFEGKNAYITFRNVGDKLMVDGNTIYGFSMCSENGVYLPANASLISDDTVSVSCAEIETPVSVAYAYSQYNGTANLFASRNDEKLLAVSPFISDKNSITQTWQNDAWTNCDYDSYWHCHSNEYTGFYNTWNAESASIAFDTDTVINGDASLLITSDSNQFSISPNFTFNVDGEQELFQDIDTVWSNYATLSFKVKVSSDQDLIFNGLNIFTTNKLWFSCSIEDDDTGSYAIPADGQWHEIKLDLNQLHPFGNAAAESYSHNILNNVTGVTFSFTTNESTVTNFNFDDVRFTADTTPRKNINSKLDLSQEKNFFDKIKAFFYSIYLRILILFKII